MANPNELAGRTSVLDVTEGNRPFAGIDDVLAKGPRDTVPMSALVSPWHIRPVRYEYKVGPTVW